MIEEFEVRKFNYEKEGEVLASWRKSFGDLDVPYDCYPENTFIAYYKNTPIASGSMYLTDAKVIYAENFIANPSCKGELRDRCLDLILLKIRQLGKEKGKKYWVANSRLKSIYERSKKHQLTGFCENNYWLRGDL